MAFAPSGAVTAGMLAAALAACGGADPAVREPVSAQGSISSAVDSQEAELLLPAPAGEAVLPENRVRVSVAKLTWNEEVAASTEAGDAPLFELRGLENEPENVDGN